MTNPFRTALRSIARFAGARSGASAVVFGLSALPMIGLIGIGVDYAQGLSYKRRLDAANDSAALAAIAAAQTYYSANVGSMSEPGLTTNAVAAGQAQGVKAFAINAGPTANVGTPVPAVNVNRNGRTFTASSTYAGQMNTSIGKLFGTKVFPIGGTAKSSLTLGSYLDFYLALDVSGSMGLPTSTSDQQKLAAINTDNVTGGFNYPNGCAFGCHFAGWRGYGIAHANNIKLRVDSVASAVSSLIQRATSTATLPNQYRIGVYPFIDNVMQAAAISSNFTAAQTVANTLGDTYLDSGMSNPATQAMGSGGTHFENVLPPFNNYIQVVGDGSTPQKAKPILVIVTDGADNNQTWNGWQWSAGGSQPREPNNFGYCSYAYQQGVTIAIIYTPYIPIKYPQAGEDYAVNNIISNIPGDLRSCAAPGYFFTANTDADVTNALDQIFSQAVQAARLTN